MDKKTKDNLRIRAFMLHWQELIQDLPISDKKVKQMAKDAAFDSYNKGDLVNSLMNIVIDVTEEEVKKRYR